MTAEPTGAGAQDAAQSFAPVIENACAKGPVVLVCEHASHAIPAVWGTLGLDAAQARAHIAWDPGALDLARGLSRRLDAVLIHAPVSRLVYDLNRAPHQPGAMPLRSEMHDIPGNADLTPAERLARTRGIYLPFHAAVRALVAERLALGQSPVIVTVHSFTPVWFGQPRKVELGVLHDRDPAFAEAILARMQTAGGIDARLNEPYSAADDVTHTLRLQATPLGLPNAMLELRNDLIATPEAAEGMAERLAPAITGAIGDLTAKNPDRTTGRTEEPAL